MMKKILYLGNKLEKHGNSATNIDTLSPLLEAEGYHVKSVSSFKNKPLRLLHMLSSIVTGEKIDIVLIDTYSTTNFWYVVLGAKLCKLFNLQYILILHGGKLKQRISHSSDWILQIFHKAEANVVPSHFLKDQLREFQFENIVCIPNSIEITNYRFKKRKDLKPRLLWVRAFNEIYNPELFLKLVKKLQKYYPDLTACMVGPDKDGTLEKMKAISESQELNIQFTGKLSKAEWIDLSESYDIFINTTNVDNTPVSLIEAMALGLPIVSTNVGGIPYLISHEENGLLIESNNVQSMTEAVIKLLEDQKMAERLSIAGRRKSEEFDWKKVKLKWLDLLG